MDPITLTGLALTILSPFIAKVGEGFATRVGDEVFEQGKRLYKAIRDRFTQQPDGGKASTVLENFTKDPEEYSSNFENKLLLLLQQDTEFAETLKKIIESGPPLSPEQQIIARDNAQVLRNRMSNTTGIGKQKIAAEGSSHIEGNEMSIGQRPEGWSEVDKRDRYND